ncbi:MAG: MotA/TolQ/ExbB proton channel family protein [Chlamydiales bacterium]|nr:MotA/TolQ/ExbB proton channel family protein [Chlamydiales bacterium]
MRFFPLFLLGASVFSALSQADPLQAEVIAPSEMAMEEPEREDFLLLAEEESSLFEQEMEKFEQEILALEEELKKDAESLIEDNIQEVAISQEVQQEPLVMQEISEMQEPVILSDAIIEDLIENPPATEIVQQENQLESLPDLEVVQQEAQIDAPLAVETHQTEDLLVQEVKMEVLAADPLPSQNAVQDAVPEQITLLESIPQIEESPAILNIEADRLEKKNSPIEVNLEQAFQGSPIIYSVLLGMSALAFCIWLYSILSMQRSVRIPSTFIKNVKNKLSSNHFDDALALCTHYENLIGKMVASGIQSRRHGLPIMIESMKAEGKRASVHFWQRISLLNDIAVLAPMLGLLGTVLGMFYAFYDVNRSIESVSTLFDGLGVSVGTTVAGLLVAILALILHSIAKYRLVRALATVENEAQSLATLIDDRSSEYRG